MYGIKKKKPYMKCMVNVGRYTSPMEHIGYGPGILLLLLLLLLYLPTFS